jgi:hypothetical protein
MSPTSITPRSGLPTFIPKEHKYLTWSWALLFIQRQGMTRPQFARYYLMRLGIGSELKRVALNPDNPYKLASMEEVLALRPELRPPE